MNSNKVLVLRDTHLTWLVRLVEPGDTYGKDFCLTNKGNEPYVEFYDIRYSHTDFGQFVQRYYKSSIMTEVASGLCLDFSEPEWAVSERCMDKVKEWLG